MDSIDRMINVLEVYTESADLYLFAFVNRLSVDELGDFLRDKMGEEYEYLAYFRWTEVKVEDE